MCAVEDSEDNFISETQKKELEEYQPHSPEIFAEDREKSLLTTPQKQNLPKDEPDISFNQNSITLVNGSFAAISLLTKLPQSSYPSPPILLLLSSSVYFSIYVTLFTA